MLFGGNLVRQPVFIQLKIDFPDSFRIASELKGADTIMNHSLFLGTYPGLTSDMINHELSIIKSFVRKKIQAL